MLRNHPCRVIVSWPKDQKIGYDDRPAAGRIIDSLNVHLAKANSATVNGVYWTEAGNLVIRIKTPDHAKALAGNFDQWRRQMLKGAQAARLDRKIHQVVIQGALIRDEHDQPLTADAIATHLTQATEIKLNDLAMPPRIVAKPDTLMTLNRAPILVPLRDETKASRLKEDLKCINCSGHHASTDLACPVWIKRRGTVKEGAKTPGGRAPKKWNAKASKQANSKDRTTSSQQTPRLNGYQRNTYRRAAKQGPKENEGDIG
ncbi:SubName: Full=Uncharacterized protein {ECO:0000313/EMBL:CCA76203.1} [Serendipita indica DSM 11827]|nr:SubName: Full=Uncharacterized protein {ECO:0000313/EMBL:CCA76203.1} [Serendipita indica DSM 11827]